MLVGFTAILVAGHVFAPTAEGGTLGIDWLPFDLGYHLIWMVLAAGVVLYMTEKVWPEAEE